MGRAPFDTTCDLYTGPGTASPGTFIGTFPCRLVVEDGIEPVGTGNRDIPYYLTIDAYQPRGAWTAPFFGMDAALSDQVAVPSGTMPQWWVLYTDHIIWRGQAEYFRSYLVDLPIPSIVSSGGVLVGGTAIPTRIASVIPSGGVLVGGTAIPTRIASVIPSGGVLVGGTAIPSFIRTMLTSGGVLLGGETPIYRVRQIVSEGGCRIGGNAVPTFTPGITDRISDNFNVSNQTNAGRTPNVANVPGNTYVNVSGTCSVVSNTLQVTSYAGGAGWTWISNGQPATGITVKLRLASSAGSVRQTILTLLRGVDTSNLWFFEIDINAGANNNTLYLVEVAAGVSITRAQQTVTINADTDYTLTITDNGSSMAGTINGVTTSYSSTASNTGQLVGFYFASADSNNYGSRVDDFRVN